MRLMLKNQIMVFNKLLEDQLQIMNKDFPSGINSMSLPNGSNSNPCKTSISSSEVFLSVKLLFNLRKICFFFVFFCLLM